MKTVLFTKLVGYYSSIVMFIIRRHEGLHKNINTMFTVPLILISSIVLVFHLWLKKNAFRL